MLLVAGAFISPLAVAITMLIYNIFGTLVNSYQLSKVINYSLREQFIDLKESFLMCLIMSGVIYPMSFWKANCWIIIGSQILLGVGVYLGMSIITHNESYYAIKNLIKEKLDGNK